MDAVELPEDWTELQRSVFSSVHRFMVANQTAMCHPKQYPILTEHWQTIAHNAAFVAAEFSYECDSLRVIDVDTHEVLAESPPRRMDS